MIYESLLKQLGQDLRHVLQKLGCIIYQHTHTRERKDTNEYERDDNNGMTTTNARTEIGVG
jgi:hypothetical protein